MAMQRAGVATSDRTMDENISRLFEGLKGIFADLVGIGAQWGEPWGIVFPVFVVLAVALAFVGGFRYMFQKAQQNIKPFFFAGLAVVGLLIFQAIQESNELQGGVADSPPTSPAEDG